MTNPTPNRRIRAAAPGRPKQGPAFAEGRSPYLASGEPS